MHAASVNPEPGSNSLKNCISLLHPLKNEADTFFRAKFVLAFFTYSSFFLFKVFNEIPLHFSVLIRNFFVVQFSMTKPNRSRGQLVYYTTFFPRCQYLFWIFFKFFEKWRKWQKIQKASQTFVQYYHKVSFQKIHIYVLTSRFYSAIILLALKRCEC